MIDVKYNGRFGNNLFQYAISRILAEKYGHGLKKYSGEYSEYLVNCQCEIEDKHVCDNSVTTFNGNTVDLTTVPSGNILVDGYFQKAEYYIEHRDKLKQWFKVPEIEFAPETDDIILHIRRSDFGYSHNGGMVSLKFYTDILDNIKYNNVYITGGVSHFGNIQDIDHTVKTHFKKYNPIYIKGTPIKAFRAIQKFTNVVQSMSTFCWWACFLSDKAERIYTPITTAGYWSETSDIDLKINDEKYIYINNVSVDIV